MNQITEWVRAVINHIEMKLLAGPYTSHVSEPGNKGMTSVAIIETSHIALHIWDETDRGLLQLDVYSCAEFRPEDIFIAVNDMFGTQSLEYRFLDREKELVEVAI